MASSSWTLSIEWDCGGSSIIIFKKKAAQNSLIYINQVAYPIERAREIYKLLIWHGWRLENCPSMVIARFDNAHGRDIFFCRSGNTPFNTLDSWRNFLRSGGVIKISQIKENGIQLLSFRHASSNANIVRVNATDFIAGEAWEIYRAMILAGWRYDEARFIGAPSYYDLQHYANEQNDFASPEDHEYYCYNPVRDNHPGWSEYEDWAGENTDKEGSWIPNEDD